MRDQLRSLVQPLRQQAARLGRWQMASHGDGTAKGAGGRARVTAALAGGWKSVSSGTARVTRQIRLSPGQLGVLGVFLVGAAALGFILQPGGSRSAPPATSAAAPATTAATDEGPTVRPVERVGAVSTPDSSPARADTADAALDRLSGEVAKINKRLDEMVSAQKETNARVLALEAPGAADRPGTRTPAARDPAPQVAAAAALAAAAAAKARNEGLTVHRAPSAPPVPAAPPRPDPLAARRIALAAAAGRAEYRANLVRIRQERRRRAIRRFFGFPF